MLIDDGRPARRACGGGLLLEDYVGAEGNKKAEPSVIRAVLIQNITIMPLLFIFFGLRFQFYSCYGPRTC